MGIYDREYYREEGSGFSFGGERSMVTNIIIINVGLFIIDAFLANGQISTFLAVRADLFMQPWNAWKLLTAGFVHDPESIMHVGFNMYGLWLFGRDVEGVYGRMEFLKFYLTAVVLASLCWLVTQVAAFGPSDHAYMLGASGAVMAVMVVYVFHFPQRTFLFFGVVPVPAWALVCGYVAFDVLGARQDLGGQPTNVAYMAHLGGAAYGFIFYRTRFTFGWLWPSELTKRLKRKPPLKIHRAEQPEEQPMQDRLDAILEKIQTNGLESLSREEQQFMENASRHFRQRKR